MSKIITSSQPQGGDCVPGRVAQGARGHGRALSGCSRFLGVGTAQGCGDGAFWRAPPVPVSASSTPRKRGCRTGGRGSESRGRELGMKGRAAAEAGRREPPRVHMKHKDEFFKKKKIIKKKNQRDVEREIRGRQSSETHGVERTRGAGGRRRRRRRSRGAGGAVSRGPYRLSPSR